MERNDSMEIVNAGVYRSAAPNLCSFLSSTETIKPLNLRNVYTNRNWLKLSQWFYADYQWFKVMTNLTDAMNLASQLFSSLRKCVSPQSLVVLWWKRSIISQRDTFYFGNCFMRKLCQTLSWLKNILFQLMTILKLYSEKIKCN